MQKKWPLGVSITRRSGHGSGQSLCRLRVREEALCCVSVAVNRNQRLLLSIKISFTLIALKEGARFGYVAGPRSLVAVQIIVDGRSSRSWSGAAGEGDAWDLLEIFDEGDVVPICQECGDGFALAVTDF